MNLSLKTILVVFSLFVLVCSNELGCTRCGCSSKDTIAELTGTQGTVSRDYSHSMLTWQSARIGDTFTFGDGLQTGSNAEAILILMKDAELRVKAATTIRFSDTIPIKAQAGFQVIHGEAELYTQNDQLTIQTRMGLAILSKDTRLRITGTDEDITFNVAIGNAKIITSKNSEQWLHSGQFVTLPYKETLLQVIPSSTDANMNTRILDTSSLDSDQDTVLSAATQNEKFESSLSSSPTKEHTDVTKPRGLNYADLTVLAGDSFIVHAQAFPIAIELRFSNQCPHEGRVSILGKKSTGVGDNAVSLLFPKGRSRYVLYCIDEGGNLAAKPSTQGAVTLIRDRTKIRLKKTAPVSYVDTDGRNYKILYQNQLPEVVVKWPNAPAETPYELHITSEKKGAQTFQSPKPEYKLDSRILSEGAHKLKFTVPSTGKRSRTTTLRIRFDNAAPKAILESPINGGFVRGARVLVKGIALPGWNVSSAGGEINTDDQNRFWGEVNHPARLRSLAVRLTHPQRGVHYYVRQSHSALTEK